MKQAKDFKLQLTLLALEAVGIGQIELGNRRRRQQLVGTAHEVHPRELVHGQTVVDVPDWAASVTQTSATINQSTKQESYLTYGPQIHGLGIRLVMARKPEKIM